jgi:predicted signal transduction protein with EAL and GGDEF domain
MPIAKKQPLKQLTIYQSPVRLLVVIFFSVFAAEAFIMFLLAFLQPISIRMWAFLDAILLILLLSPALYFFGFRPLILHITERKQAGEEAQSLKQQMEFILGVTKTGLDIIDSDFNIRFIDTEWQKVYGDPTGRKCYEYFMGRSEVCPGCGIPKALETKTFTVTEEVLVKEGNRPIQVTTLPFQNKEGEWLVAEVNVDITERKRMEEKLLYLSTHDVLTGLYNRTYFDEEMVKLERGRQFPVSLLMVDVDELKTVNDKQGHAAGDELLRRTAQVLGASVRVPESEATSLQCF